MITFLHSYLMQIKRHNITVFCYYLFTPTKINIVSQILTHIFVYILIAICNINDNIYNFCIYSRAQMRKQNIVHITYFK